MDFNELLLAANSGLKDFFADEKVEPISARTLRYWISKGVLDKRGTRGPKTTYPESFVWRVILTRQYQLLTSMTLDQIAAAQAEVNDDDVMLTVWSFRRDRMKTRKSKKPDTETAARRKRMDRAPSMKKDAAYFASLAKQDSGRSQARMELSKVPAPDSITDHDYLGLGWGEQALSHSEESIRDALAAAADRSDQLIQEEARRLSQHVEDALSEIRNESRSMHFECLETMRGLAATLNDLRQQIEELNGEVMHLRKSFPNNIGEE